MIDVRVASTRELDACLAIRHEVFVRGQGVPADLEVDGLDPSCVHFVARAGEEAIGTARLRVTEDGHAKAERVAVREEWRGRGVGVGLMEALEAEARRRGHAEVVLYSQADAIPFYERLGYVGEGDRFLEAGIVHLEMRKRLR